ncbi:MAG: ABC transporter ATP-binding protein [Clostridiales bacterium]
MLKIAQVTKTYGKTIATNNINVADGQIAVLLGPNGAGKSTIIKCIAGLLRFQGEITINGHDNHSIEAKKSLGYIPEMPAIYELLTVEEHLQFIARAYQLHHWQPFAEQLLERLELADKKHKLGRELSKGMQQKLSILLAMLPQPQNIIFDEPLVGLDPHAIKELKQIFRELKEQNCALLISTHMLDSVEDYWDIAHIMMNGHFATSKQYQDTSGKSLEELFFAITEQPTANSKKEGIDQ